MLYQDRYLADISNNVISFVYNLENTTIKKIIENLL